MTQWTLRYAEPKKEGGKIIYSDERHIFEAPDYNTAGSYMEQFLKQGGIIFDAKRHSRAFIGLSGGKFSFEAGEIAKAFFGSKLKDPSLIPYERLSGLQKRMQDGSRLSKMKKE